MRAELIKKPWRWQWSSVKDHVGLGKGLVELTDISSYMKIDTNKWKEYLSAWEKQEELESIRKHTRKGFPLGAEEFLQKLGKKIGKPLKQKPRGRPKKGEGNKK